MKEDKLLKCCIKFLQTSEPDRKTSFHQVTCSFYKNLFSHHHLWISFGSASYFVIVLTREELFSAYQPVCRQAGIKTGDHEKNSPGLLCDLLFSRQHFFFCTKP